MRLVTPPAEVGTTRFDSKSQMMEASRDCEVVIDVDDAAEAIREYHLLQLRRSDDSCGLAVRVSSQGDGIEPEARFLGNILLIGCNGSYAGIDIAERRLLYSGSLDGVFFELLPVDGEAAMLVVH